MTRTPDEHDLLVLALAAKILPLLKDEESGVGVAALLTIVGAVLKKGQDAVGDGSTPEWVQILIPLIGIGLYDIAHSLEPSALRES